MRKDILKKYFLGSGVDVSRIHYLKEALHQYAEPNNLYLLKNIIGVESQDYLFASDIINKTKYFKILLYEWFVVIKIGGYLIIELKDNGILDYLGLKRIINSLKLYQDKYSVIEEYEKEGRKGIVIQKKKSIIKLGDSIDKWTFGIVTNGKRQEFIEKSIESIRALHIPYYEIIICGTYFGKKAKDIKYIHFNEKDDKGWITKKKNFICENAQYENITVIHDRIYFDKNWFQGMKRWGNYFDVLSCPIVLPTKEHNFTNWETVGPGWKKEDDQKMFHSNAKLDPVDWDENVYVGGAFITLKKSTWKTEKWNEDLFWGDAEDIEYSLRQHRNGIIIRFNPYAKVKSFTVSGVSLKGAIHYQKNSQKLGKYHAPFFLTYLLKFLDFLGFRRNQKVVNYIIKFLKQKTGATDWRMKKS